MKKGKRRAHLPPLGGGQDLAEVLKSINEELATARERQEKGEDGAADEVARLEREKAEAEREKAGGGEEESELERLRREKRERDMKDAAKLIGGLYKQEKEAEAQRTRDAILAAVKEEIGSDSGVDLEGIVKSALSEPGGSRFVGQHASREVVEHVAAGGTVDKGGVILRDRPSIEVGAHREAQKMLESKSFALFFRAAWRHSKGWASDGERQFLMEARNKALAEGTDASGGYIIPPEWMPDLLAILRATAVVRRAGPRIVPFGKQMNQVALSTGAVAGYTAENAAIAKSEETLSQVILLTPHNLTALVPVSNYLLADSLRTEAIVSAEDMVRRDMAEVMALREDLAFLQGPGSGGEPLGLKNQAGIITNPIAITGGTANGFQPTLTQIRTIKNRVRTLNVTNPQWVWFFNPLFLNYVEGLTDTLGRPLYESNLLTYDDAGNGQSGKLEGVQFYTTTQIPANLTTGTSTNSTYLLLVNIREAVIGQNQDLVVDVSSEASYTPDGGTTWVSSFQNEQTLFRSLIRHDIAHRYPGTIVLQSGVLV